MSAKLEVFYVSPDGCDDWSGRSPDAPRNVKVSPKCTNIDGPFATIDRARDAVRSVLAAARGSKAKRPVRVLLRGGTYTLSRTLELLPEDSGTAEAPVTYGAYPGESPILSGGQVIGDWKVTSHNGKTCWTARLPEVCDASILVAPATVPPASDSCHREQQEQQKRQDAGKMSATHEGGTPSTHADGTSATQTARWNFTQLFVNGVRRPRTRRPREGYFRFAELPEGRHGMFHRVKSAGFETGQVLASWRNFSDVDLVTLQHWFESHLHLASVDEQAKIVHFANFARSDLSDETNLNARYYIENVFEDLAEPGQWYLDRPTGTLYYLPLPGERPENTRVVAPRLETLVHLRGQIEGDKVRHVRLENLDFRHAQWRLPEANAGAIQGANSVPGAIKLQATEDCVLYGCRVSRIAQYAVEIGTGSRRTRVLACELHDLGGGGVKVDSESGLRDGADNTGGQTLIGTGAFEGLDIGMWGPPGKHPYRLAGRDAAPGTDTEIADCVIRDGGILYHSAHGVWIGDSGYCHVHHNEIFNFRYSGISSGWTWSYCPSYTIANRFEYNHVHHIGMGVLSDLGGIYTLGLHPGSTIVGNVFHDISAYGYGGWGVYQDQASAFFRVENNLVYRTQGGGFLQNYGKDAVVRNNIFALARDCEINPGRAEAVLTMVFENNIVYGAGGGPVSGNWVKPTVFADRNLYWRDDGKALTFNHFPLEHWQSKGCDAHSLAADPLFEAPRAGRFALRPDSPALKLGFAPFDPALAGPRKGPRAATCDDLPAQKIVKDAIIACRFEVGPATTPTASPEDMKRLSNEPDLVPVKPGCDQQVSLTVENFGRSRGKGAIVLAIDPPAAGRSHGPKKLAYDLAPNERKSVTFNVSISKGATHFFVRAASQPASKSAPRKTKSASFITPAALLLTLDRQPTWSMPRVPAIAQPEQVAAALGQFKPLELPWASHTAARFRCALAGDHLAVLAEGNDVRLEQARPPWEGSCIEVFGSRPGVSENGQIVLAPQTPSQEAQGWVFKGACCPEPLVRLHTRKTEGGYVLSVLIPADLLKIDPAGKQLLLEISLTTALAAAQGEFIRVQAYGAPCPSANSTGYALVTIT